VHHRKTTMPIRLIKIIYDRLLINLCYFSDWEVLIVFKMLPEAAGSEVTVLHYKDQPKAGKYK